MARHTVVWLQVDAAEAWRRIAHSDRPLASDAESVGTLLADPPAALRRARRRGGADGRPRDGPPRPADAPRLADLPAGHEAALGQRARRRVPGAGRPRPARLPTGGRCESRRFLVTDRSVGPLYAERLEPLAATAEIEAGETAKTLANTEKVLRALSREGMTREDHVVALGGGVVGDLAGLVAHLYQRGVPVVQVPTTLVSQVDSAYGGKVGVDLPEGKNYAGAFQQPAAVIADTETLATLPPTELAAGFVEVLKTGLLAGGALWERVRAIEAARPRRARRRVFACARYKCAIVAADERDTGLRNVLNLGHTVGHAIESATGYTAYRHGEAVGLGLLAALRLSDAPALRDEVEAILAAPRPADPPRGADRGRRHPRRRSAATRSGPPPASASSSSPSPASPGSASWSTPLRSKSAVKELLLVSTTRNRVAVLHGVNFDILERRDPDLYGGRSLSQLEHQIAGWAREAGLEPLFFQTNHEGEFVEYLHRLPDLADASLINAGAWTHYSRAIADALDVAGAARGRGPPLRRRGARGLAQGLGLRRPGGREDLRQGRRRLPRGARRARPRARGGGLMRGRGDRLEAVARPSAGSTASWSPT